jgi:hypothetical protein
MFRFGHKSKDKDQKDKKDKDDKKKEKKEKKEKEKKDKQREPMTEEEINRLDEVKKGIFRRLSERDKSKKSGHKSHDEGVHVGRDMIKVSDTIQQIRKLLTHKLYGFDQNNI